MSQVIALLQTKLRILGNQIALVRYESKLKIAVLTFSAIIIWLGAYIWLYYGFRWLLNFGNMGGGAYVFGELLLRQVLSLFALAVFLLLIFSNILVAFSTLYKSKEVFYLLQGPLSYNQFFYVRFVECLLFSSWALAFLGSPLILAYGQSIQMTPAFYLAAIGFFIPYIIIPAAIGAIITMLLVRIFPQIRVQTMIALGVMVLVGFFYYMVTILRKTRVAEDTPIAVFFDSMSRIQSRLLPSFWATEGLFSAGRLDYTEALFWWLMSISTALMLLVVAGWVAGKAFYPGWSYLNGQDRQRFKPENRGILNALLQPLNMLPLPIQALSKKDIRLFWRDPTQWSQFVIFFGIMAIYIANLRNTSRFYEQDIWRSWVACLNVGSVSLILATQTSRFVFPLISLEGHRFWILRLAPLSLRQLIWQKFWLSVVTTSGVTVGLALMSGYLLELEPAFYFMTVYGVALTNLGLAGLAVGLGSLYPTLSEDNPARIVSGMGGTLNLLLSIGYISLLVSAQGIVLLWDVAAFLTGRGDFFWAYTLTLVFVTITSLLAVWLPMKAGLRHLERLEF